MPSSTGSPPPASEASPEKDCSLQQGDRDAEELYERQKFPHKYQDLHPDAQLLDRQLFQTLQTIVKGSLLSIISQLTGQYASYLMEVIAEPTKVYDIVDNSVAIHWVKAGKITEGNQYLDLAYHQPREWERDGSIVVTAIHTEDNISDLGSQPCGPAELGCFLLILCGYVAWVFTHHRGTISFT